MTQGPDTLVDALAVLHAEGYTADFNITGEVLNCHACAADHPPVDGIIERQYRFEGPTDPGDEVVVFGVRCPACGARGVLVSAYGPDADPETLAWVHKAAS